MSTSPSPALAPAEVAPRFGRITMLRLVIAAAWTWLVTQSVNPFVDDAEAWSLLASLPLLGVPWLALWLHDFRGRKAIGVNGALGFLFAGSVASVICFLVAKLGYLGLQWLMTRYG